MYLYNGRMAQVGIDSGRPLGFRGIGDGSSGGTVASTCNPFTDLDCLLQSPADAMSQVVTGTIDSSQYTTAAAPFNANTPKPPSWFSQNSGLILGLTIAFLGVMILAPPMPRR
jgi:hypothetical protein